MCLPNSLHRKNPSCRKHKKFIKIPISGGRSEDPICVKELHVAGTWQWCLLLDNLCSALCPCLLSRGFLGRVPNRSPWMFVHKVIFVVKRICCFSVSMLSLILLLFTRHAKAGVRYCKKTQGPPLTRTHHYCLGTCIPVGERGVYKNHGDGWPW